MRSIRTYAVIGMGLIVPPISTAEAQRLEGNALRMPNASDSTGIRSAIEHRLAPQLDSATQPLRPAPRRADPYDCKARVAKSAIVGGVVGAVLGSFFGKFPDGGTPESRQNGPILGFAIGAGFMALDSALRCAS